MVILYESEGERVLPALEDELGLDGFAIQSVRLRGPLGDRVDEYRGTETDAVVHLPSTQEAHIWVFKEGTADELPVRNLVQEERNKPELLALRCTELLRGSLLPGETSPTPVPLTPKRMGRKFSLSVGPALTVTGYGPAGVGAFIDGSLWWDRWALGVFFDSSFNRQAWDPHPQHFSVAHLSLGPQGRFIAWTRERVELHLLAQLSVRALSINEEGGTEGDEFRLWSAAIQAGIGADFNVRVTPRLRIGGLFMGQLAQPFLWPAPPETAKSKEQEIIQEQSDQSSMTAHFVFAPHLSLDF